MIQKNDKILDESILLAAYRAEEITKEKLKRDGREDYCSFLGTFIKTGDETLITRYDGMRDIMLGINREELKKELFVMLYAQIFIEKKWCRTLTLNYNNVFRDLFSKLKLDSKDYEKVFDYLLKKYPEEFNRFITEKMKNFLGNILNHNINDYIVFGKYEIRSEEYWNNNLYRDYYTEEFLKQIDNFRKGKRRLRVISVKEIEEYTKKLAI